MNLDIDSYPGLQHYHKTIVVNPIANPKITMFIDGW